MRSTMMTMIYMLCPSWYGGISHAKPSVSVYMILSYRFPGGWAWASLLYPVLERLLGDDPTSPPRL